MTKIAAERRAENSNSKHLNYTSRLWDEHSRGVKFSAHLTACVQVFALCHAETNNDIVKRPRIVCWEFRSRFFCSPSAKPLMYFSCFPTTSRKTDFRTAGALSRVAMSAFDFLRRGAKPKLALSCRLGPFRVADALDIYHR